MLSPQSSQDSTKLFSVSRFRHSGFPYVRMLLSHASEFDKMVLMDTAHSHGNKGPMLYNLSVVRFFSSLLGQASSFLLLSSPN